MAAFDRFKYQGSTIPTKGQTKPDLRAVAQLSDSDDEEASVSDQKFGLIDRRDKVSNSNSGGTLKNGEDTIECPSCSGPVQNVAGADFVFCGKRPCTVEAARMFTSEVKARDEKIKKLTQSLDEAQERIAELESIITADQFNKDRPKTWDDFVQD